MSTHRALSRAGCASVHSASPWLLGSSGGTRGRPRRGAARPPPEEVAGLDLTYPPDGQGLPQGLGLGGAWAGLYDERCATCHGEKGEDTSAWPSPVGGTGHAGQTSRASLRTRPSHTFGSKLTMRALGLHPPVAALPVEPARSQPTRSTR